MLVAETQGITDIFIILVGSGGIIGAIVSFFKIRPDVDNAAISQAQGAMETMKELNDALARDVVYWRDRFEEERKAKREAYAHINELEHKLADLERRWGDLTS